MNDMLKELHEYCSQPRRAQDVADYFDITLHAARGRIGMLRKMKGLSMHRTKHKNSKQYECWYTKTEVEVKVQKKPYKTLGICVWGVWF